MTEAQRVARGRDAVERVLATVLPLDVARERANNLAQALADGEEQAEPTARELLARYVDAEHLPALAGKVARVWGLATQRTNLERFVAQLLAGVDAEEAAAHARAGGES